MSSSSSSSFSHSKNSAFTPYSRYADKSPCIVPKEWKEYPQQTLKTTLQTNLVSHWNTFRKVEGAVVQMGDVAAKLEYNDKRLWMKRYGDVRSKPHPQEYALTYVDKYGPQK
ncbi:uncharacterized protein LOC133519458 [Cydia pomonella]|uniref:uncharacterized protein LOC133519458 n=1 Tax=Cydia pomonella TaxID=82600 RepID=UPI002ADD51C0|nr:uncharacterized protein LOC133519458 [Cydia pomonella]